MDYGLFLFQETYANFVPCPLLNSNLLEQITKMQSIQRGISDLNERERQLAHWGCEEAGGVRGEVLQWLKL